MNLRSRQHRKWVNEWKEKLRNFDDGWTPGQGVERLLALDIALIENGIYGMLALVKSFGTRELVEQTLYDILSSNGEPEHWRNQEGKPRKKKASARLKPKRA